MKAWVGTSGFSYKEWKGSFYPEDLPAKDMLRHYAGRLPAVEINNTFYRLPKIEVLESWRELVPSSFRFVLKASQKITHIKRLEGSEEETGYLLRAAGALGERLGPILFQLPPNFRKDLPRLEAFLNLLAQLDDGIRAAFEFRHPSWFDETVFESLRRHGCALCTADVDEEEDARVESTAAWGYLRLRRTEYDEQSLARWSDRVMAQGWSEAFVFFKHEDGGVGPRLAGRFVELLTAGQGGGVG